MKTQYQRYDANHKPILLAHDLTQLDKYGVYGLIKRDCYGILERLKKAGIISIDIRRRY